MRTGSGEGQQPATDDAGFRGAPLRYVVLAGHRGERERVVELSSHSDPAVRAAALGALLRVEALDAVTLLSAMDDPHPTVRRRACLLAARLPGVARQADVARQAGSARQADVVDALARKLLSDDDTLVVEAAAFALGELGPHVPGPGVEALSSVSRHHRDARCREAAVAALGAVGDARGLDAVLDALADRPPVRRRAAVALAAFDDPRADAALRKSLGDRDWQVRQAAEDLLGRP